MRGDGRIYQRGTTWWVEYWHRGEQVRESSKSAERRVAQRLLQTRRRTAGTAQFIAPKTEQLPFSVLTDLYLMDQRVNRSLDHAERYVRNLLAAFGDARAGCDRGPDRGVPGPASLRRTRARERQPRAGRAPAHVQARRPQRQAPRQSAHRDPRRVRERPGRLPRTAGVRSGLRAPPGLPARRDPLRVPDGLAGRRDPRA